MRDDEGPAKNLLLRRTKKRPARHNGPLLVFRSQEQKSILKLGRFSSSFAEITDKMNLEPASAGCGSGFRLLIYHHVLEKSNPESFFLYISCTPADVMLRMRRIEQILCQTWRCDASSKSFSPACASKHTVAENQARSQNKKTQKHKTR